MRPLFVLLLACSAAWAHHATATEFDVRSLILLRGTIRNIEWINPHAWLYLEVADAKGGMVVWQIEGASPNALIRNAFPKEAVKVGMEISITGYPAKNGKAMADGGTITFKDGTRLFFGGSAPRDGLDSDGKPCIINLGRDSVCAIP